ncbi:MAG: ATPase domain-containing protein [Candidatus Bathyarchaeia archaeon]
MVTLESADRVPTGISGLDEIAGGGFPKNSLIILAGNPGTGKTIFSAHFLYYGAANYGEKGVYVSFAESKEAFLKNMRGLGLDFEKLEKEGKFRFLDMVTVRSEAVSTVLEAILKEVSGLGAKRLVIDSFSALAQAFREAHEVRVVLHTILSKVTRLLGCTTILIVEVPYGESRMGLGIEEFVADAIILLRRSDFRGGRIVRDLELLKMRGAPLYNTHMIFTLKDGFKAFPPTKAEQIERVSRFQPQPDTKEYFSTGSPDIDRMLEGGCLRGSMALIEITDAYVSELQYHCLVTPILWNFLAHGRGIIDIPSRGVDHNLVRMRMERGGFTKEEINSLLRVCVKECPGLKLEPYIVTLKGKSFSEDYMKYVEIEQELTERTGQPVLYILGTDTLIDFYGIKDTLSTLRTHATRLRETKGLSVMVLKPGYPRFAELIGAIADVHLRVTREYGTMIVYGIKPRTCLYALEMDVSKGYVLPKLTPII